jgi:alpha-ketoglutaric semialdehyde dehydrogenase
MEACGHYIDGVWRSPGETQSSVNPSDASDTVGFYTQGIAEDVAEAIAAARSAQPAWADASPQTRADVLDRVGTLLLDQSAILGDILAREEGKTLPEAIGEATRAGHIFKFFAGEALRNAGEIIESTRRGVVVDVTREPVGVVGVIAPWNFPLAIPAWKIAPALAFGNTVVFKPADLTPACAVALARIVEQAGAPRGVFNLVTGKGRVVGEALAASRDIDALSFTGSVETGAHMKALWAQRPGRLQLEMGGKNPLVVLSDADMDVAVACAVNGAFFSTGQRCTATSRIIVTRDIARPFVTALKTRMAALVVGDARSPDTDIGPVVDSRQMAINLNALERARMQGANCHGGEMLQLATTGHYLRPALLLDVTPGMSAYRDEIFGPIAAVLEVDDYEQALAAANDSPFGLSAGICTTSLKHAAHFKRHADAGMVMVNLPTAGVDYHVPFGGRKGSSYGPREQGRYARDFYTQVKTAYTAP